MKIAIGSDHAGFEMKECIKKYLEENGYEYHDFGAETLDPQDDYPIYGEKVAKAVASGNYDRGIAICGTGIGISIVANKVPGIRAATSYNIEMAKISRLHNDANVLALGGRITDIDMALKIVDEWLKTPFTDEERHIRRINQIQEIEKSVSNEKE